MLEMSTAEIGKSLAPLIRAGKVHAITCTGANLEEDLFNLLPIENIENLNESIKLINMSSNIIKRNRIMINAGEIGRHA